jgi:integrase
MFTKPEVYNPTEMTHRGFVSFYHNNQRKRYYDGSQVGLECAPAACTTHRQRQQELERLQYHIHKLLLSGWEPVSGDAITRSRLITDLQEEKLKSIYPKHLSERHKKDFKYAARKFRTYLVAQNLGHIRTSSVTQDLIQGYLDTITSSASYYMIVRNRISGLFSLFMQEKKISYNPVKGTKTRTKVTKRNRAFTEQQFKQVLEHLKNNNEKLYLCALLMYGCFLRPHEEIRNLKRDHFNEQLTMISMDGDEVKSRRLRVVPVPSYIREELCRQNINNLPATHSIFTKRLKVPKSEEYFGTIWKRVKRKLLKDNVITENHTLYSIRHTAAVSLFRRTQDLSKLSQLMGHADVNVTLVYLKSLGVLLNISENDLPTL